MEENMSLIYIVPHPRDIEFIEQHFKLDDDQETSYPSW